MALQTSVISGILKIGELFLKRVLDPETQERLYKVALTKRKRKAIEEAEQMFLRLERFLTFTDKNIKILDKKQFKKYSSYKRQLREGKKNFFKYNN